MLSPTHRARLRGLSRADSVSWNPHKMLGAPLQCSMFVVRHKARGEFARGVGRGSIHGW